MKLTIEVTDETTLEQLEDAVATLNGLAKSKRKRLQADQAPASKVRKGRAPRAPVGVTTPLPPGPPAFVPVPPVATPVPDMPSGQPDNRTALQAPVPFVPHAGHAPPPVVTPVPVRPDVAEPLQGPLAGTPTWPTEPVKTSSGQMALPAPVFIGQPTPNVALGGAQRSGPTPS